MRMWKYILFSKHTRGNSLYEMWQDIENEKGEGEPVLELEVEFHVRI